MTVLKETSSCELPADDDRARVPRRPRSWGARVRWTRRAIQAVVIALVGWRAVGHVTSGSESAEAWCPLGGFEGAWTMVTTGRTVPHVHTSSLVLAAAVLLLALAGRGFFCGWLCPLGSLQEMVHAGGRWVTDRVPPLRRLRRRMSRGAGIERWRQVDRVLRWGRWLVLAWAIIGAAVTGAMVFRVADPWIALLTVAEFELSLAFVVLIATFVLALFIERPFCRYACPLGALQSLAGKVSPIAVERDASACLGCDLCNQACPMAIPVNARTRVTDTSCNGCLECVGACPSQNALAVTLAVPTFRIGRTSPPTPEANLPAATEQEILR
jgi:Fe-S-cluster-containing hydrogenase component 2